MIGKRILTPNFSAIFRVHAMCEKRLSIDRPSSSQFLVFNSAATPAKPMNSVVQTGVKSDGCEKSTSYLPR